MLRVSLTFHSNRRIPLYHRNAMPLMKGSHWFGKWGATSRFFGRVVMSEQVTPKRTIQAIDRDMLNYVQTQRLRHYQMARSYSQRTLTHERRRAEKVLWQRQWLRKVQLSYKSYMHFATMKTLEEQAKLVHKYGQASVNRALGDYFGTSGDFEAPPMVGGAVVPGSSSAAGQRDTVTYFNGGRKIISGAEHEAARRRAVASMSRTITAPPVVQPVKKHHVTRFQIHAARFDLKWKQES
jgi:hypothetical protein